MKRKSYWPSSNAEKLTILKVDRLDRRAHELLIVGPCFIKFQNVLDILKYTAKTNFSHIFCFEIIPRTFRSIPVLNSIINLYTWYSRLSLSTATFLGSVLGSTSCCNWTLGLNVSTGKLWNKISLQIVYYITYTCS